MRLALRHIRSILILALLLAGFISVGLVSAHAKLKSAEPAPGSRLTSAPTSVKIIFTEEVSADPTQAYFKVSDSSGKVIATGALDKSDLDHTTLIATLPSGLGNGVYTVNWRGFTPDDSGISTGTFSFGVNADPGPQGNVEGVAEEDAATPTVEATAAPTKSAATATVAATSIAPTRAAATPTPATPATLPHTGSDGSEEIWLLIGGAFLLLAAGAVLFRSAKQRL